MKRNIDQILEERPGINVFLLSFFTCGLYLIYWYYKVYEEWEELTGTTFTGNVFLLDFFLYIITCGIWGIYVDYRISEEMLRFQKENNLRAEDTGTMVVVLDVLSYLTAMLTNIISSVIQQDMMNRMRRELSDGSSGPGDPSGPGDRSSPGDRSGPGGDSTTAGSSGPESFDRGDNPY